MSRNMFGRQNVWFTSLVFGNIIGSQNVCFGEKFVCFGKYLALRVVMCLFREISGFGHVIFRFFCWGKIQVGKCLDWIIFIWKLFGLENVCFAGWDGPREPGLASLLLHQECPRILSSLEAVPAFLLSSRYCSTGLVLLIRSQLREKQRNGKVSSDRIALHPTRTFKLY